MGQGGSQSPVYSEIVLRGLWTNLSFGDLSRWHDSLSLGPKDALGPGLSKILWIAAMTCASSTWILSPSASAFCSTQKRCRGCSSFVGMCVTRTKSTPRYRDRRPTTSFTSLGCRYPPVAPIQDWAPWSMSSALLMSLKLPEHAEMTCEGSFMPVQRPSLDPRRSTAPVL